MHRSPQGFALHVLPALLYLVGIFVGGSLPKLPDTGLEFEHLDKLMHLVAFAGLELLMWRAVRYSWPAGSARSQLLVSLLATSGSGALLEVWQGALPARQAEGLDWVADTLGALLVAVLLWRGGRAAAPDAARST